MLSLRQRTEWIKYKYFLNFVEWQIEFIVFDKDTGANAAVYIL